MDSNQKIPHVVVIGGGYAGLYACQRLSRAARKGEIRLTVITKENFHIWHGFIGEMLTGRILPTQILSPVRRIFKDATLHIGIVRRIDLSNKTIQTIREIDGRSMELTYDKLIVTVGSKQNSESFQGLAEHGFALKTWDDCYQLKNHILRMYELASITSDPTERKAMLTFFVAGGGFSGSEVAGELADFARQLARKDFPGLNPEEVEVFLAHPQETILPELFGTRVDARQSKQFPGLVAYAERHLKKLGVTIRTNIRIQAVSRNLVVLSDGTRVPTRTVISAVGTIPQKMTKESGFPLAPNGRILVDRTLRVHGYENVWAAGDCAAVEHPKGGYVPTTAWWGMMTGQTAGANVIRQLHGKTQKKFSKTGLGQAVSIGRRTAVGELWGVPLRGTFAWIMWRLVLYFYFPFSDRKIRLLVDWALWPLMGRDIVEMSTDDTDDFEIRRVKFQPGEKIVSGGQTGHSIYLIKDGNCSVFEGNGHEHKLIKTLSVGDKIVLNELDGQASEVVANTLVQAIELRDDQLSELEQVLELLRKKG